MNISEDTFERTARLAKLHFSPEETDRIIEDMEEILSFMHQMNAVDTSDVSPFTHTRPYFPERMEQKPVAGLPRQSVLGNAPDSKNNHFRFPPAIQTIEESEK